MSTESAGEYSSAAKGETLEDTIRTVEGYSDIIVLRHFSAGAARRAANAVPESPVINAGDGPGQHPTQALLDTYTIYNELGRLDNIKVGLVGDLANGRTVRSLASMLTAFDNVSFYFIAPDVVKMGDDIKAELDEKGVHWEESTDLISVASEVDVLAGTFHFISFHPTQLPHRELKTSSLSAPCVSSLAAPRRLTPKKTYREIVR